MATLSTSEHSRKRQVWTIQIVLIKSYFPDYVNDKIRKMDVRF